MASQVALLALVGLAQAAPLLCYRQAQGDCGGGGGGGGGVVVTVPSTTRIVTETVEVDIDLGPDYFTQYFEVDGGTTTPVAVTVPPMSTVYRTPATSTIHVQATQTITPDTSTLYTPEDVTTTPPTQTATITQTPDLSTVFETSVVNDEPPTSTLTAVQTVSTGYAACTTFRLVFPASCCPNTYTSMTRLTPGRHRMKRDYTLFYGEATSTVTQFETVTLAQPEVEVDVTDTYYDEAPTPTVTAGDTVTVTNDAPTPLATVTDTQTEYAPTPLVTLASTVYHAAAAPLATVYENAPTPLTTSTVLSTNTLATPTTTITSTAFAQSTACAQKTVYTQAQWPANPAVRAVVQNAQVAALNLYKRMGGKSILVDCGDAGTFAY
ncbi:hypothetical protein JCM10049v2_006452 [Rhodotorula toruloides]